MFLDSFRGKFQGNKIVVNASAGMGALMGSVCI